MPQVLVTQRIDSLQGRTYPAGVVVSFADAELVAWLKGRYFVDDGAVAIAAAITSGARTMSHVTPAEQVLTINKLLKAHKVARTIRERFGDILALPLPAGLALPAADTPTITTGTSDPSGGADPAPIKIYLHGGTAELADGLALNPSQMDEVDRWIAGGNRGLNYRCFAGGCLSVPGNVVNYGQNGPQMQDPTLAIGMQAFNAYFMGRHTGRVFAPRALNGSEWEVWVGPPGGDLSTFTRLTGVAGSSNGGSWSADTGTYTVGTTTSGVGSFKLVFPTSATRDIILKPGSVSGGRASPGGGFGSIYIGAGETLEPILPGLPQWGLVADSWGNQSPGANIVDRLLSSFGWRVKIVNTCVGGSGMTSGAGVNSALGDPANTVGKFPNFLERVLNLDLRGGSYPKLFVLCGENEHAYLTKAVESARRFFAAWRERHPETEQIYLVTSNGSVAQFATGAAEVMENAMVSAVSEYGVDFIRLQGHSDGPLFTGNGSTGGTAAAAARPAPGTCQLYMGGASGNDLDHPSRAGVWAVADRIVDRVVSDMRRQLARLSV